MPSQVFFGSARQARLEAKETLPAKLDLILERLRVRTPTFANIPPLVVMLKGCSLPDVPVLVTGGPGKGGVGAQI